jgi:hypothetical protein
MMMRTLCLRRRLIPLPETEFTHCEVAEADGQVTRETFHVFKVTDSFLLNDVQLRVSSHPTTEPGNHTMVLTLNLVTDDAYSRLFRHPVTITNHTSTLFGHRDISSHLLRPRQLYPGDLIMVSRMYVGTGLKFHSTVMLGQKI